MNFKQALEMKTIFLFLFFYFILFCFCFCFFVFFQKFQKFNIKQTIRKKRFLEFFFSLIIGKKKHDAKKRINKLLSAKKNMTRTKELINHLEEKENPK